MAATSDRSDVLSFSPRDLAHSRGGAMNSAVCIVVVVALLQAAGAPPVRDELTLHYEEPQQKASWDVSIERLASGESDARREAAGHLVEVMALALADEQ